MLLLPFFLLLAAVFFGGFVLLLVWLVRQVGKGGPRGPVGRSDGSGFPPVFPTPPLGDSGFLAVSSDDASSRPLESGANDSGSSGSSSGCDDGGSSSSCDSGGGCGGGGGD